MTSNQGEAELGPPTDAQAARYVTALRYLPAALFFLFGLPFLRKTGIHYDASYELASFYSCCTPQFKVALFHHSEPLMIIQYLGALKAWLYLPILHFLPVTPFFVRFPTLVVGSLSVLLSFSILERIGGTRAALAGSFLLATDAVFLIATSYDFGPIAFLHFFLLSGMALLIRFERTRSGKDLALAFFLFGLAFWDKALFVWMFVGLMAASAVVLRRHVLRLISSRRLIVATASFVLGSSPLIYYNVVTHGATLHTDSIMSARAPVAQKARILKSTMDGSVMFGWMTEETYPGISHPAALPTAVKVSVAIVHLVGSVRSNCLWYAFLASCALIPWLWFTPSRAPVAFTAVYLCVAWGLMLAVPNAGASLHHAILLWPFPHFLIALAGSQLSKSIPKAGPALLGCALVVLVVANVALMNQYYADLMTRGTTAIWTDAIYPLAQQLKAYQSRRIVTVDWGYSDTLCLLSNGNIPMSDISFALLSPSRAQEAWIETMVKDPNIVFVDHTARDWQFQDAHTHLQAISDRTGYVRDVLSVVRDRNERPRFEVYRYVAQR
jgi:hypothetical protein